MLTKKHVGLWAVIHFVDHCTGIQASLMDCEVVGKIISVNDMQVTLENWSIRTGSDEVKENNAERTCIAQKTITAYMLLKGTKFKSLTTSIN